MYSRIRPPRPETRPSRPARRAPGTGRPCPSKAAAATFLDPFQPAWPRRHPTTNDNLQPRGAAGRRPSPRRGIRRSAAADRGDHVDPRARVQGGLQTRALAVDVHVDVRTQRRARLAEPVPQAGPALVEPLDGLVDGGRLDLQAAREAAEE